MFTSAISFAKIHRFSGDFTPYRATKEQSSTLNNWWFRIVDSLRLVKTKNDTVKVLEEPCMEWTKGLTNGYAACPFQGRTWRGHVLSYMRYHDLSVVPKKQEDGQLCCIRHMCNNTLCMNPTHLLFGTYRDNVEDMVKSGRCQEIINPSLAKLTSQNAQNLVKLYTKDRSDIGELANSFNVTKVTVKRVLSGETWSHHTGIKKPKLNPRNNSTYRDLIMSEADWETLKVRLEKFVRSSGESDGCLIWTGSTSCGYGMVSFMGARLKAHIATVAVYHLKWPGDNDVVRHLCNTKQCVNISHLCIGTQQQNVWDYMLLDNHHWSRVTIGQVNTIVNMSHMTGHTIEQIATEYNLSIKQVRRIVRGKCWVFALTQENRELVFQYQNWLKTTKIASIEMKRSVAFGASTVDLSHRYELPIEKVKSVINNPLKVDGITEELLSAHKYLYPKRTGNSNAVVRKARKLKSAGLTRKAIAHEVGVSEQTVKNIFNKKGRKRIVSETPDNNEIWAIEVMTKYEHLNPLKYEPTKITPPTTFTDQRINLVTDKKTIYY